MAEVNKIDSKTAAKQSELKKVEVEQQPMEVSFSGKNSGSVDNSEVTLFGGSPQNNAPDNSSILFITPEKRAKVAAEQEEKMAAQEAQKMETLTKSNEKIGDTSELTQDEKNYFASLTKGGAFFDKTEGTLDVRLQAAYPDATPDELKEIKENVMAGNNMKDEKNVPNTLRLSKIMPTKTGEVYADGYSYKDGAFLDRTGGTLDERLQSVYPDATPDQLKEIKENVMAGNNMEDEKNVPNTLRLSKIMPTKSGEVYSANLYKKGEKVYYDNYKSNIGAYSVSVSEGDNLSKILKDAYKSVDPNLLKIVAEHNNLKNMNDLQVGQKLNLPAKVETSKGTYYANGGPAETVENSENFKMLIRDAVREGRSQEM